MYGGGYMPVYVSKPGYWYNNKYMGIYERVFTTQI